MTLTAKLDKDNYNPGDKMSLTLNEDYVGKRTIKVVDSGGASFTKTAGTDKGQGGTWTANAPAAKVGTNEIVVTMTPSKGSQQTAKATYSVGSQTPASANIIGQSMESVASNIPKGVVDAIPAYFQPGDFTGSGQILWTSSGDNTMKVVQKGIALGAKTFWFSFKDGGTAAEAAKIEKFLASCPKDQGYTYMVTYFHEHNGNIDDGSLSLATYKAGSKLVADAAHKHGMLFGPNHNGSRKNPSTGKWGFWPEVWKKQESDVSLYDFWGVDGYLPKYQDPAVLFKGAVDYAKELGLPLCWRESASPADDPTAQAKTGTQLRDFFLKNCKVGLWWSSQVSGSGTINYRMLEGTAKNFYKL